MTENQYLGKNCVTPVASRVLVARTVWHLIQITAFSLSPRPLHFFRAFLLKCFGASIPNIFSVVIFPSAKITYPWKLHLAEHCMIGPEVKIYNLGDVFLHFGANISQNVHICSGSHDYTKWSMPLVCKPITIGANAWIAADCFIGPGVTIGELSIIGARSVVINDQPPRQICAGHPCKPIKSRPLPN
jgi:putative colanic acid biosynthesis acetyltransferase WcaF